MFGNINRRQKVKINHEGKKGETEIVTVPSIRILRSATNFRRLYKSTNKIKSISFIYQKSDWLIALRPMVYNDWLCDVPANSAGALACSEFAAGCHAGMNA